jgi:hypothetical protein
MTLRIATYGLMLATLFIAACANPASSKDENITANALVKAAQNLERRAAQSFAGGEFDSAAAGYESAALVYETLALPEPQARARLSQARALADAGRTEQALALVTTLLQTPAGLSTDALATAYGRAAALSLDTDIPKAQAYVQNAAKVCANTCAQSSAISTLRARTELATKQPTVAVASASAALAAAQNNNDRANALRVRAQANAVLALHAQVVPDAQQALAFDQALGLAARVLVDLQLLQEAYAAQGDTVAAARYAALAQRAIAAAASLRGEVAK